MFRHFESDQRVVFPKCFGDEMLPMLRDYALITLGVLTLLATSAAVYGILTINTQIQANPEQQVKIPDYTAELDSLKSQVDSINSQVNSINSQISTMSNSLTVLTTLKSNVADISGKLSDLQTKTDTSEQSSSTSLAIVLDKSNYLQTDTIKITVVGANPQKTVDIELLDSTGYVVLHKTTWSDSSGKVSYDMTLSSALPVGNYQVQIISDKQTRAQPITITSSTSSSTSSNAFTVQTDKTVYNTGDFIQVLGAGQAGTSITGVLTSPSGKTYSTATTIQSDGSFVMFFSPSQPYEIGNWNILVTNLGQSKSLVIHVGSGTSSNSYTFTAQADKAVYNKGDLIKVSGTGQPNTSISAVFTSPSGQAHTITTTANADGTYTLFFSIVQSYETGNWLVSMTNISQSKTFSIYIQS